MEIIAFPCNQFGGAERGTVSDIRAFCDKVGAHFRVMEKINVNPPNEHPVYSLLKQGGSRIKWNFNSKFIVECMGERCTISRYDGVRTKALRAHVEEALLVRE